ncbi:MAG: lamin tail domain-containing protein, partial [Bacilli bacterium]|nr:lamin tail domain-containing protein [Bacilli bacterium]
MKKVGLIIILFAISIILVYLFYDDKDYIKTGNLYISEIVSSNSYTYKNEDGEYVDYIEIYNGNSYDVDLLNYHLTDSIVDTNKWTFPSITIKSHEYMIIYADRKNTCESTCHTSFKLNKEGETLSLIDDTGNIISRVRYPKLSSDVSYSYVNKKYVITEPTPGKENIEVEIKSVDVSKYKIKINEYMTHNKSSNYVTNGGYYDFVELYNEGDSDLNIKGLSLSDNPENLNKFIL